MAYTTALYIRLSQEDDNIGESDSIKNQRDLLTDFVANHAELSKSNILYFSDDGFSGTNFERPAVKEMLEQVKKGEINCIVVKDFSRFGRSYIEVGGYLEQVFPFLGVRFLSVNDFFDSNQNIGRTTGIEIGFKTLIYDLYSKDLSVKTKSGKLAKTKKGEHIDAATPFGYLRSKTTKNAWIVDEDAAVTIRKIFCLASDGMPVCEIAKTLNNEGIPTPLTHRTNNNNHLGLHCRRVDEVPFWRMGNVSKILRDERYTGKLIAGKTRKVAVGGRKTIATPKNEWIVVPNAHEPIVSEEAYNTVQSLLNPYNERKLNRTASNIFANKIFCGHCNHTLRRYEGLNTKYVCHSNRLIHRDACFTDVIYENSIMEIVLAAILQEVSLAFDTKSENNKQKDKLFHQQEQLSEQIRKLTAEVKRLKNNKATLFEEYSDGKIGKEDFLSLKSVQTGFIEQIEANIANITAELQKQHHNKSNSGNHELFTPFDHAKELTPEMMKLVDRITVYDAKHVEIKFAFTDAFATELLPTKENLYGTAK